MSESRLLSRKGAIYFVLAFAVVTLIILNFWGWFFLRGIERQILRQLGQQLNNTSRVYALQISEKFFFEDILMLPQSDLRLLPLQQLLYEYRETGDLENIFIVSVDKAQLIDGEVSLDKRQRLQDFPLNDSLFRKAVLGQQPEAERITFAGQYFVTTYTPVFDFSGNVIAILVSEAPAHIFTTLQFFRRTLLYAGILGLTAIIFFGTLIVLAIRRLFQAEEKLYQQARLAQLGQMAAMVAHEIRKLFDFIPDEINRLNRLVNDFLQFARRRDLKLEKQNPLDIINSILQQLNDPRIQTGFANPAPELMLDSDSFKQVMLNIIDNARQAISAEGNILVRTEVSRPRQFIIEIEDNGAGMSPENLKKIFDPFFSTRATGSGLGMAITKQLVEQMNGKVSVFSKERQGTTVKLEFPV
jgi:signal transduction histidine kinase